MLPDTVTAAPLASVIEPPASSSRLAPAMLALIARLRVAVRVRLLFDDQMIGPATVRSPASAALLNVLTVTALNPSWFTMVLVSTTWFPTLKASLKKPAALMTPPLDRPVAMVRLLGSSSSVPVRPVGARRSTAPL